MLVQRVHYDRTSPYPYGGKVQQTNQVHQDPTQPPKEVGSDRFSTIQRQQQIKRD
jgi:hypothetical protein